MKSDIPILYQKNGLLIVDKPAGCAVHGGEGIRTTLLRRLQEQLQCEDCRLLHRLDRGTSGVIALSTGTGTRHRMQIEQARKYYLALCPGRLRRKTGTISSDVLVRGKQKSASTHYRVLRHFAGYSLLLLLLGSGRMHQIRSHLAGISHPVLGDQQYGDFKRNREFAQRRGIRRMMLHAWALCLPAARGAAPQVVAAPLPREFLEVLGVYQVAVPGTDEIISAERSLPRGPSGQSRH